MAVRPVDTRSLAVSPDVDLGFIQQRMGVLVAGAREPTEFGWWLLQEMARFEPPLSQAALARAIADRQRAQGEATVVGQNTISRWIHDPGKPRTDLLAVLVDTLNHLRTQAGLTLPPLDLGQVIYLAGHGAAPTTAPRPQPDPRNVTRARHILTSPDIPPHERAALDAVLDAVLAPYDKYLPGNLRRAS